MEQVLRGQRLMPSLLLDTHVLIWYLLASDDLSPTALAAIEQAMEAGNIVYISAITIVEIIYLTEKGKLPDTALQRMKDSLRLSDSGFEVTSLDEAVAWALRQVPRDIVPDMPDRLIVATALHLDVPLVTRDSKIHKAGIDVIW